MLYQTLVGAWPLEGPDADFTARLQAYALKAAREGKVETSWTNPNADYEQGLADFVEGILDPRRSAAFIASFQAYAERAALIGALSSLSQLALKATMPGVPDFYQGTELWDLSLVDPDNRRAVDFTARARLLDALGATPDWNALASRWRDGHIKLALTRRLLAWRYKHQSVFERGGYRPLQVSGRDRDRVVAFARTSRRQAAIVIVGRGFADLTDGGKRWPAAADWQADVALDGFSRVRSALGPDVEFAGATVPVSALFGAMPVALLHADIG
jgi:(1->4)-alpha-D-glucan 1-alpha-D-glucosylmutase